jgi:hypothetical protein
LHGQNSQTKFGHDHLYNSRFFVVEIVETSVNFDHDHLMIKMGLWSWQKWSFHNSRGETSRAETIDSQLARVSRLHNCIVKARAEQSLKLTLRRRQFCGGILAREGR